MSNLFGTDGIRGKANSWPITPEMGVRIGKAAAIFFSGSGAGLHAASCKAPDSGKGGKPARIMIGRDTRISGEMLEMAISSGIMAMGGNVVCLDVVPTPAVAFLTKHTGADAGIVISASHNPYYDNGIKFFDSNGLKLDLETESRLSDLILDPETDSKSTTVERPGTVISQDFLHDEYIRFLKSSVKESVLSSPEKGEAVRPDAEPVTGPITASASVDFRGIRIVVDCANGAASYIAPKVLESLGAEVITIFNTPDGININNDCGSEHVGHVSSLVVEKRANLGLAFDGDADRLIAVDENGREITGDQIIAICAGHAVETGTKKPGDTVVTTVMSNIGLKIALEEMGLRHEITDVGDRNVLFRMLETGSIIGGEDSGHMIFLDRHTTGDGIYSALKLLEALNASGKKLSELAGIMAVYPQVLINIDVREKPDLSSVPSIASAIRDAEAKLEGKGRVLVRYSGTQPMCRVMVEGQCREETEKLCFEIADAVKKAIGG